MRALPRALLALTTFLGCAHEAELGGRLGAAEAQSFYYGDNQGLSVITAGATVEHPLTESLSVTSQALVDRIKVERPTITVTDSGGQPTGHRHLPNGDAVSISAMDAITSASVSVTGGDKLEKTRLEGTLGAIYDRAVEGAPTRFQGYLRTSQENDYQSYSGRIRVSSELLERNTTVAAFVGYGHDLISPIKAPPGEDDRWPASHDRWIGGASVSQLLSQTVVLSGGVGLTRMSGTLENPYRRALVLTTKFPERLPHERFRVTAFVALDWYLFWDTALHVRQGAYFDDWGVKAWIPEAALVKDFGQDLQLSIRYRYYLQSRASFYGSIYGALQPLLSGDDRLGPIVNHAPGLELIWTVSGNRGRPGAFSVKAGYTLNRLSYVDLETAAAVGHIVNAGASLAY